MKEYPVIIVGSGPAGSSCARALKDEGIEALVIEKKALPRFKVCTGLVLGQARLLVEQYFGEATPKEVLSEPGILNASDVVGWDREEGFSPYTMEIAKDGQTFSQEYLNVWRDKFDYWLLQKSGVEFRDKCKFLGFVQDGDKVKVRLSDTSKKGVEEDIRCSYLVVADGSGSMVKKALDPMFTEMVPIILGAYQPYFHIVDMGKLSDQICYVFHEREFGDLFTIVHRKDNLLAACLGGLKGRNIRKSMQSLKTFLADEFAVTLGEIEMAEGCIISIEPPLLGKGRVLLTGGAAGLIYLEGEGISPAIDSGYKAGKAICQAVKEGKDALEIYEREAAPILNHMQVCMGQTHLMVQDEEANIFKEAHYGVVGDYKEVLPAFKERLKEHLGRK